MDSDDDILDLEVGAADLEGMDLDDPPIPSSHRGDGGQVVQIRQDTPRKSTSEKVSSDNVQVISDNVQVSSGAQKPKKKRQSAKARLESRRRARLKRKIKHREERQARKSEATKQREQQIANIKVADPELGETIQQRTHYDELMPGVFGTYYHLSANTQSALPPGYFSSDEEDEFNPEELLEPEDRPWLKGHRRPKVPAREVEKTPEATSDKPVLERTKQQFFESPSTQLAAQAIQDKWMLYEREILLKDGELLKFEGQRMPDDTIADILKILQDPQRTEGRKTPYNRVYSLEPTPKQDEFLQDFVQEVRRTRVLCVNTEGTAIEIKNNGEEPKPRAMITFGALNGMVLFFDNHEKLPLEFRQMLSDPGITKIGCGLTKEFSELERVGLFMHNWVETGALRLALYSQTWEAFVPDPARPRAKRHQFGSRRYGIGEQIEDLVQEGFLPKNYRRTNYQTDWGESLTKGEIATGMWKHLWENGRIPCAYLLMVTWDFARSRGLPDDHPAMGILHEALDLCRGRDPNDFQRNLEPSLRPKNWWFAHHGTGTAKDRMRLPADCIETVLMRRTFADFIEPVNIGNPREIANQIYDRFFGKDPVPFPTLQEVNKDIRFTLTVLRCICCGARDHTTDCSKVPEPECKYEHDGEQALKPHTTEFCPILHNYCGMCFTVGHHERVHYDSRFLKTGRELRERYFRFMATGAYTSLPFLALHPEGAKKLNAAHWRRSYDGRNHRQSPITRYMLGIGQPELNILGANSAKHPSAKTRVEDRDKQLQLVRDNIEKTRLGQTVPLPRDFMENLERERQVDTLLKRQAQVVQGQKIQRKTTE